jgi:Ca2+-binding RTX toxin-like protein
MTLPRNLAGCPDAAMQDCTGVLKLFSGEGSMITPFAFDARTGASVTAYLFVDPRVADWWTLTQDVSSTTRVVVLDVARDGVAQMAAALREVRDLGAIHILSHGAPADIRIGTNGLNASNLAFYADELSSIGASLRTGGDILVYGCEVGQGWEGRTFVERLDRMTGATVAAAEGPVGAAALGGNWELFTRSGDITAPVFASGAARSAYPGLLVVKFTNQPDPLGSIGSFEGRMIVGDFDSDGDADILYQNGNTAGAGFGYMRNNGGGAFTNFSDANAAGTPFDTFDFSDEQLSVNALFAVDYDKDGDVDIIDREPGGGLGIWRNDAGIFTNQPDPLGSIGSFEGRMIVGDFDSDGDADILYQNGNTAGAGFGYMRNNGGGAFTNFSDANAAGTPFDTFDFSDEQLSVNALFAVDYDKDGDVDIIDREPGGGLGIWRNDAGIFTNQPDPLGSIGSFEGRMIVGDFDSDGDADILYQNGNTAGAGFGYMRNNGGGAFTNFSDANAAGTPFDTFDFSDEQLSVDALFAVDYDKDGDVDIIDRDAGGGLGIWAQNGSGDGSPPELISSTPADNATGFSPSANLTLAFDEAVFAGGGNIYLRRTSDDFLVETISISDAGKVSGTGTATLTINPATTLAGSTGYYLTFDLDAIVDSDGVGFGRLDGVVRADITDKTFLNFTTAAANTAPTLGNLNGDAPAFTEGGTPVFLDAGGDATVTDAESANFDTGTVTVAITANRVADEDVLGIDNQGSGPGQIGLSGANVTYAGTTIGTFTGGSGTDNLVVTLNANATPPIVQALVRALTYSNTDGIDPTAGDRTISVTVTDGDGGTSSTAVVTMGVDAVNDAPSLIAAGGTPTFTEGGAAVDLFSGVSASTGEAGQAIDQITLTVENLADGSDEILGIDGTNVALVDGETGTTSANGISYSIAVVGGVATITLSMSAGISSAAAEALIDGLTYANTSQDPGTADRIVTLTEIRDNGGGTDATSLSIGATVSITAVNDAPTLSGGPVELPATDEDFPNAEVTVADLLAGTTLGDVDGDDIGIAVTGLTGNGEWEYSTDGGFTWLSFGSVSDGHALLLSPDTLVSYMPDGIDGETATINFRAWDQTAGTPSDDTTRQYADTSVNGGTSAYSSGTVQASVEVEAVNDAPIFRLSPGLDFVVTLPDDDAVDVISGDGDGDALGGSPEGAGTGPSDVVLGDFDGDGDLDVAVNNTVAGTVTVLENDGCGCLAPFESSPIPITPGAVSMVSGDFNGDGKLDLAAAGPLGTMNVLLGAGDGSFVSTAVPVVFGFGLTEIVVGDFNKDGKLDIAAATSLGALIGTGDGNGSFLFTPPAPSGMLPGSIATGDIDGVNGLDLVITDAASGLVSVLLNNGFGGFNPSIPVLTPGGAATDVQLGDFNGDGKFDMVLSEAGLDTVSVMLSAGGGAFFPATTYQVGQDPSSLTLADMNDDGSLDIVVVNTGSEDIDVLLGKGDGTFSPDLTPIPTYGVPQDIAVGQMDTEFEWLYPRLVEFTEGDTLTLAPRLELEDADPDGGTAVGATVFLDDSSGPGGLPGDVLAADTTGTAITAVYDPDTFTLTLTGNDTLANYEKVLRTVTFSSGDDPDGSVADPGNYLPLRIVGMTIDDGKDYGEGYSAPIIIGITATGAQDDAFTIREDRILGAGENLFDDNGDGLDSGPDFIIAAVNGSAANVDTQFTLPSGALLTVNSDGTFSYDPNGKFDSLPGPLSGATNLTATESFTYTLEGGYTATVTITITGVDSDGDLLIGNASDNTLDGGFGADTMEGKGGNDTYIVNDAGDVVVELAGEGTADRVSAQTSYALASDADIELLTTTNSKGTTAINLQGNALSQTIVGNDGDNLLNDGGIAGPGLGSSPDIMSGRGGNDTYAVYNAADVIIEGKNDGTADRVTAGVSYVLGAGVYVEYLNTTSVLAAISINLTGNELSQVITGNEGDNILDGGKGAADYLKGHGGNDTYIVRSAGDMIFEEAGKGYDRVAATLSYVLTADAEIELLNTTSRAATYAIDLTGNRLAQTITGNHGDNILNDGGKGAADRLEGLLGNDTYFIYNAGDVVVENAGEGTDRVAAGVSYQLTAGAEVEYLQTTSVSGTTAIDLTGNALAQVITGNAGDNILHDGGVGAADILRGFGGNDTYRVFNAGDTIVDGALQGTDRVMAAVDYTLGKGVEIELFTTNGSGGTSGIDLTGNEFAQEIVGNAGANRLDGKDGNDTLRGLGGNDMFVFSTALGAGNVDTIVDFNPAGDRVELHKSVFTALSTTGVLPGAAFWASAGGAAHDDSDRILYDTTTGNLYYDADGNGAGLAIHFATLTGAPSLSAADFVVV